MGCAGNADSLEGTLAVATTALRDLYMGYRQKEILALDGQMGIHRLLRGLVTCLRGMGVDDDHGWDCDAADGIPVAGGGAPVGQDAGLLAVATTALRDLYMDYPHKEICSIDGSLGLGELVRGLTAELRGRGIDDEGGWQCDVTEGIPVAGRRAPR
jgi:hypothetical protein